MAARAFLADLAGHAFGRQHLFAGAASPELAEGAPLQARSAQAVPSPSATSLSNCWLSCALAAVTLKSSMSLPFGHELRAEWLPASLFTWFL